MRKVPTLSRMIRSFMSSPTGLLSAIVLSILMVLVILGPHAFGDSATEVDVLHASESASSQHLLGTDSLGRDIALRTLAATRTSILLSLAAVSIAVVAGCTLGGLFAAAGGRVRRWGGILIDTLMSFGDLLLAIAVIAVVGVGAKGAVLAIAVAFTPMFARFAYSLVSSVMVRDYLASARVVGVSRGGITTRYVSRNVADAMAIAAFGAIGEGIMAMSSLSFLGLGVQAPRFDWGQMLTDGVRNFYLNPYAALAPALMITLTGMSVALFGDALARAVNPVLWDERPRWQISRWLGRSPRRTKERITPA